MLKLKRIINFLIIPILGLIVYGCSSAEKLESSYNRNEIKVDGIQTDWTNKLKSIKDENVVVGFQNDDKNLYVCLATSNRPEMMKVLLLGLTVWVKPDNAKDIIGIRYPLMRDPEELKSFRENGVSQSENNPEERIQRILAGQDELEILNKDGKTITSVPINGQSGFEAKIGYSLRQLVYELKIPLKKNNDGLAVNTGNKDEINIEFTTGELKLPVRNIYRPEDSDTDEGKKSGENGEGKKPRTIGGGRAGHRGDDLGSGPGNFDMQKNLSEKMDFEINLKLANN